MKLALTKVSCIDKFGHLLIDTPKLTMWLPIHLLAVFFNKNSILNILDNRPLRDFRGVMTAISRVGGYPEWAFPVRTVHFFLSKTLFLQFNESFN